MVAWLTFVTPDKNTPSNCKSFVDSKESDKEMQWIFVMAIGMDEAVELADFDQEPFKSSWVKKSKYKPTNTILFEEIGCCALLQGTTIPRYGNKKEADIKKWLADNPVFKNNDIIYIYHKIQMFCDLLCASAQAPLATVVTKWNGDKPFLCLYHAIICDMDMEKAFVNHHKTMSCSELDGRNNSEKCSPTFYELLADKYNDSNFVLTSIAMDVHSNFNHSMLLSLDGCLQNVTSEQIKECFKDTETKLNIILAQYEQSGMGTGTLHAMQCQNENDNIGRPWNQMCTSWCQAFGQILYKIGLWNE